MRFDSCAKSIFGHGNAGNIQMKSILLPLLLGLATLNISCSDNKRYETAMCALVDVSGTYANEKAGVVKIIKAGVIPNMLPGDSLFLITIDSNSYTREDMLASMTLDYIPSKANDQKLAFAKKLQEFADSGVSAPFTDISGAMMLCSDYLKDTGSGNKAILIFSDMQEDLQKGLKRKFRKEEFKGVDIAAMNVIKLQSDSRDPETYRSRIGKWEEEVRRGGARSWAVILEPVKVPEYVEQLKR